MVPHVLLGLAVAARAPGQLRIGAVDAQARDGLRVELHVPAVAAVVDQHVGDHGGGCASPDHRAGARVQGADQAHRRRQLPFLDIQGLAQGPLVVTAQGLQVVADDGAGGGQAGGVRSHEVELGVQALGQVPGPHTDRVQVHDPDVDGVDVLLGELQGLGDLGEGGGLVALVADAGDQGLGDGAVGGRQGGHVELPQQVVGQGLRGRVAGLEAGQLVLVAGAPHDRRVRGHPGIPVGVHPVVGAALGLVRGGVGIGDVEAGDRLGIGLRLDLVLGAGRDLLEERVLLQGLLDLLVQLKAGQLQQMDGLPQLGRHLELLGDLEL